MDFMDLWDMEKMGKLPAGLMKKWENPQMEKWKNEINGFMDL